MWWTLWFGTQTYLVHKRLSIVAPGESGDQPLFTDPTTKKLAFIANGRAVTCTCIIKFISSQNLPGITLKFGVKDKRHKALLPDDTCVSVSLSYTKWDNISGFRDIRLQVKLTQRLMYNAPDQRRNLQPRGAAREVQRRL